MIRWILAFVIIGAVALLAWWLAGNPGTASFEWMGYQIETSVAVVFLLIALLVIVAAILYRIWWSLMRMPRRLWRGHQERRRRKGEKALSRGLVAVAAGDASAAHRQAQRASARIEDASLTLLLSAQAAQLEGDEQAAGRYFAAMTERRDTEFLGVRGLLTQAMRRKDWDEALKLSRRAYRINPRSDWVVKTLYDLQKRTGRWHDAQITLNEQRRLKLMPPDVAERQHAEIQYQLSLQADGPEAIKLARKAYHADPTLVSAAVRWADLLIAEGRHSKAAKVLEDAWQGHPDPVLADRYRKARQADGGEAWLTSAKRLAARRPQHLESRLLIATAALEAKQWGDARAQLEPVADDKAPPRVCRLMARLEEGEHGDLARAREWLMRASAGEEQQTLLPPPVPSRDVAAPPPTLGPDPITLDETPETARTTAAAAS